MSEDKNTFISTLNLAKKAVALLKEEDQTSRLEKAQEAFEAFYTGNFTLSQSSDFIHIYNTVNAMVAIPGILKGQANDFCIEISSIIKNIFVKRKEDPTYVVSNEDQKYLNGLLNLYMDIIINVPAKDIRKAEKIITDQIKNNVGVTKV